MRGEVLWAPSPDALDVTSMGRFMAWLSETQGVSFNNYGELWRWSVDELEQFWGAFADWTEVRWRHPPTTVLADASMPGAVWFPGGTLNWAEHALARRSSSDVAIMGFGQTRVGCEYTWAELADAVARCRAGLRGLGVGKGDRVCAFSPNIPETLVAFIATASLGAVWSSCAPEFGTRAVVDRFAQIEPKVLLAVDGYRYGEKVIDRREEVRAVETALPTLQQTVHLSYLGVGSDDWSRLLASAEPLEFEPVPFDHPLYVLYSSGTTGLPKAIVHGHGGIVMEHLKALGLHYDIGIGSRVCWYTTTGWMMWNYLASALMLGATVVLFDGDPSYPDLSTLWRLAAETELDLFGVSAGFVMASRKAGVQPPPHRLRAVAATGSTLPAEGFRWIHDVVGSQVQPCSASGGTDVCTAFVGTSPIVPVRAGEISCRLLGVAAEAFDPRGAPCPPGVRGELVITKPLPSMPVGFWNDADGSKLRAAYFEYFPAVWRHGDWITFMEDGACILSGRSDATLNRGGVRLGTSDFYSVVEELAEVADSLVVHLDDADDAMGRLILFVAPAAGAVVDDDLRAEIAAHLRAELSPRHVPDLIEEIPAVPRTLTGKKLEIPVKRILAGTPAASVASDAALANPDALAWFERYAASIAAAKRDAAVS